MYWESALLNSALPFRTQWLITEALGISKGRRYVSSPVGVVSSGAIAMKKGNVRNVLITTIKRKVWQQKSTFLASFSAHHPCLYLHPYTQRCKKYGLQGCLGDLVLIWATATKMARPRKIQNIPLVTSAFDCRHENLSGCAEYNLICSRNA